MLKRLSKKGVMVFTGVLALAAFAMPPMASVCVYAGIAIVVLGFCAFSFSTSRTRAATVA
jgi:hypothetical protein